MQFAARARQQWRAFSVWAAHWWQFASVKLAVVAGFIAAAQAMYPNEYAQLMQALPEPVRPLVGALVMGAALWARTRTQPGIKPKGDGQ